MSTDGTLHFDCADISASLALGERLGRLLKGGQVIELISDLGGGKTTFVKGLAKGVDSNDLVSSPTFTLSNIYEGPELTIHHYDFYRLGEAGIMGDELTESLQGERAVIVIEWGDIVHDILPNDRLTIHITNTGEISRHYAVRATGASTKLLQEIQA